MKIHPAPQGTSEWLAARAGMVTASEMANIVTPDFEPRKGETPRTYRAKLLAERWLGGPLQAFTGSADTDIGHILENEALPWFTLESGLEIERVGLVTNDEGTIGCSPDGLIGPNGGIECKCPRAETHVKYLLGGEIPRDYIVQVYGCMLVTGRPWWKFISYSRGLPTLLLTEDVDETLLAKLRDAVDDFIGTMDYDWQKLCTINGGPPR